MLEPIKETILAGHYQVIRPIGRGGFGQTFLATDIHLPDNPLCVIKKLKPKETDPTTLQTAKRLFDRETQTLSRLGHHDRIPYLLDHFEQDEEFYLVQEFIEGHPLNEEITEGIQLSEASAIAILQDVLEVLAFVHQQNVIHRDIKPSNLIRRNRDGKIVLIDFGAVKEVSNQTTTNHGHVSLTVAIGSRGYMPNEQLAGTPQFSSDIYAVGILGITALTGLHPSHLKTDPRTSEICWRDRATQVSSGLAAILDKMVRYDFRDRYPTAMEVFEALQSLSSDPTELLSPSVRAPEETEAHSSEEVQPSSTYSLPTYSLPLTESINRHVQPQDLLSSPPKSDSPVVTNRQSLTRKQSLTERQSSNERQPFHPGSILAVLVSVVVSVGVTFWLTKSFLPPQLITQIFYKDEVLEGLLNEANDLREAGKYQEALKAYDQVLKYKGDVPEAYWGRCYSLNKLQQPKEAIDGCTKALDLKPDYPEALSSRGYALDQQKRYKEALEDFERAIALKGDFAEAWTNKGATLQKLNEPDEAVAAFDKATKLKPEYADAWVNRGAALWSLGRFDEAIASIEKAIQLQPDNKNALELLKKARQEREKKGR
jgi:serine/threonine protein kinase